MWVKSKCPLCGATLAPMGVAAYRGGSCSVLMCPEERQLYYRFWDGKLITQSQFMQWVDNNVEADNEEDDS